MGLLYDRNLDNGKGRISRPDGSPVEIPLDGSPFKVTQQNPEDNTRWTWRPNGGILDSADDRHFTDQNYGRRDPRRHDPNHR